MSVKLLTQEELQTLFKYESKTGNLLRIKQINRFKIGEVLGYKDKDGYIRATVNNKKYPLHHLVWLYFKGVYPNNQLDHINHIRWDNRIENLREVTASENMKNSSKSSKNSSGVVGVSWSASRQRWYSCISHKNKRVYLGRFVRYEDAVVSRKLAEIKYGYHRNHGN